MRENFNHLYLDSHERILLIHSLVELKISSFSKADIRIVLTSLFLRS